MPYITKDDRKRVAENGAETPGELNYVFTTVILNYVLEKKLSYQTINDVLGALEGAKLEFYRRVVTPYENTKITENGDVF